MFNKSVTGVYVDHQLQHPVDALVGTDQAEHSRESVGSSEMGRCNAVFNRTSPTNRTGVLEFAVDPRRDSGGEYNFIRAYGDLISALRLRDGENAV